MVNSEKVILTGASGEIGIPLSKAIIEQGYQLVVFSRNPVAARDKIPGAADYVQWSAEAAVSTDDWITAIDGALGVINCGGINMFAQRYHGVFARQVINSRILGTRSLIQVMEKVLVKPRVFINSSSQGYYGITDFDDRPLDETSPPGSGDPWGQESAAIDGEAFKAERIGVRVVSIRTGYVLDAHGGGLPQQVQQLLKGHGGATTPLNAWRSWIHIDDLVRLYLLALRDDRIVDGLNGTAPNPVTSEFFANALSLAVTGKSNTRRFPGLLLRLFMGPAADIMTHGKRIVPRKALDVGFQFEYSTLEDALKNLVPNILAERGAI